MHITPREKQVLYCVAVECLTNKEAAIRLRISPRTIEVHRKRLIEQAGARSTAELVRKATLGRWA